MKQLNDDFINRMPNFLRWILVPFAIIIAHIVVNLFLQIIHFLNAGYIGATLDSWFSWLNYFVVSPGVSTFASVMAGVYVAPHYKFVTSLIIATLFILLSGTGIMMYTVLETDYGMVLSMLASAIGAGVGVYQAKLDD